MSDYTHLIGAEDVANAGRSMRDAANTISSAAMTMQEAMDRLSQRMEDHASRLEQAMKAPEVDNFDHLSIKPGPVLWNGPLPELTPLEQTIQGLMEPDKHGKQTRPARIAGTDWFSHPVQRTLDALWKHAESSKAESSKAESSKAEVEAAINLTDRFRGSTLMDLAKGYEQATAEAERLKAMLDRDEATITKQALRLGAIESAIPATYYAGRGLEERVQRLTDDWRRDNEIVQRIDAAKAGDPECPVVRVECPYPSPAGDAVFALSKWGQQGWDAAAALRVALESADAGMLTSCHYCNASRLREDGTSYVPCDEDGCCASCGTDASVEGAIAGLKHDLAEARAALTPEVKP